MDRRDEAKRLLIYYLGRAAGRPWSEDELAEIRGIVDDMIDAAVEQIMHEIDARDVELLKPR